MIDKNLLKALHYIYERVNNSKCACPDITIGYLQDLVNNACDFVFKSKKEKSILKHKLNQIFEPIFGRRPWGCPDVEIFYTNSLMIKGLANTIKDNSLTDEHKEILSYFIIANKVCEHNSLQFYWDMEKIWSKFANHSDGEIEYRQKELNIILDDLLELGYIKMVDQDKYESSYA